MEKRWSPFLLTKRMITDGFLAEQSNSETDTECSDQSLEVGEIFRVDSETLGVRIIESPCSETRNDQICQS